MASDSVVGILKALLTLDASSFRSESRKATDASATLKKSISGIGQEAAKLTPQAERMVKAFGGDKMLYAANNMVAAVTKLGGANKLTEAEQAKVNRTVTEAIAKYKALGIAAPKAMVDIEAATRRVSPTVAAFGGALGALAGTLSVTAVVGFAKGIGEFAGRMTDLSAETSITTTRLQAFNYLGAGVGLTVEDITQGVNQLVRRLAGGDDSAERALRRVGLSAMELQRMAPDEAFIKIGEAIAGIEDPMTRTRTAFELFGRTGTRMLRLFTTDLGAVVDGVEKSGAIISDELIRKADAFDDAWTQALIRVKASIIGTLGAVASGITAASKTPGTFADAKVGGGTGLPAHVQVLDAKKIEAEYQASLKKTQELVIARDQAILTGNTRVQEATEAEIAAIERQSAALLKSIEHQEVIKRLREDIYGDAIIGRARDLVEAIGNTANLDKIVAARQIEINKAVTEAIAVYAALGKTAPASMLAIAQATALAGAHTGNLFLAMQALPPVIEAAAESVNGDLLPSVHGLDAAFESSARAKELREELERMGAILPGVAIENERASETVTKHARSWEGLADSLRASFGQLEEASVGSLATLLFGLGDDTRDLKKVAEEAHQDFLRIQRSGKSTAEELTLAFRRWHEAEDRANNGFAERFKNVWLSIQRAITSILNDLLQYFVKSFIGGLIKGMLGAKLGQRLGGLLGGGSGGGGGGGLTGLAGAALPGLLGGGGAAAGTTTVIAGTGIPVATGSAGAAGAGGAAGGAGAGSFLTNPAFWSNPWTIGGIAAAAVLTWGITKKGWFRGGEEGVQVNPKRDQFIGQFGNITGLGNKLLRAFVGKGASPADAEAQRVNLIDRQLLAADSMKEFQSAERNIAAALAPVNVKMFNFGGFVPPGAVQPAILHGGSMGEAVVPLAKLAEMTRPNPQVVRLEVHNHINTIDAAGVRQFVESSSFVDSLARVYENNHGFLATRFAQAAL